MNTNIIVDQIFASGFFPKKKKLIKELAELLKLSHSTVYNKLNHNSNFSLKEILLICQKYSVSIDQFIFDGKGMDTPLPFHSDALRSMPKSYIDYLKNIQLHTSRLGRISNSKLSIVVNEFSIFHLLPYDHLVYLKLFMWNMIGWSNSKDFMGYDPDHLLKAVEYPDVKRSIRTVFERTPTLEIWTPNLMRNLISSIQYLDKADLLSNEHKN